MLEMIAKAFGESLIITGFIFVMMLLIEYVNVRTRGIWQMSISGSKWRQYLFGVVLGAIPGCLGAYTAVALYSHRLFGLGAIVATMIATSGDEAFVMLAMFPGTAIFITIILMITGIIAGYITDRIVNTEKFRADFIDNKLPLHKEEKCECFDAGEFKTNLIKPSKKRIVFILIIIAILAAVLSGIMMGEAPLWIKMTVIITSVFSLFVVLTVPRHFIEEHLWNHIFKIHLPRIFLWTLSILILVNVLLFYVDLKPLITDNMVFVLVFAVLLGIIPESGPHLVFVTLFAQGTIPLSVLIASSISQDGHGMLPLLAESKKSFLIVKIINIITALIVGFGFYFFENI